jgi:uncharacterized protein (TIGR00251 family)
LIHTKATPDGSTFRVRVAPGASRERIVGEHGDALKVGVREPPEKGRANDAVERLLALALRVKAGDVSVVRGHAARDKVVLVRGLPEAELKARLTALL